MIHYGDKPSNAICIKSKAFLDANFIFVITFICFSDYKSDTLLLNKNWKTEHIKRKIDHIQPQISGNLECHTAKTKHCKETLQRILTNCLFSGGVFQSTNLITYSILKGYVIK